MKYNITYQEAYASTMQLNVDFEYKEEKYRATCVYYNGSGLEDIDVYNEKHELSTPEDGLYEIAKEIFENMDIEKHLTL